jgi:hypothetical protein
MKKFLFLGSLALFMISSLSFKGNAQAKVIWTQVVQLDGDAANSGSEAKGVAIFRLTSDMQLNYRLMVLHPDAGDMQTAAHIHYGGAGQNGGVAIGLAGSATDFGKNLSIQLTPAQFEDLLNDALYVNFHSTMYPSGNIRGQIR